MILTNKTNKIHDIKAKKFIWNIWVYILLAITSFILVIPFFWMIFTAFKIPMEIYVVPIRFLPEQLRWSNFSDVWEACPFFHFMFNSFFVATVTTLLQLFFCAMGAYAFARLNFKGRDKLFIAYLGTMMIPPQVTYIPMFIIFSKIDLVDTYWGLIIPGIFSAYGTFLLRQFFMGIPKTLEESVRIDGGGYWLCFMRIIIPMSKPALATLGTFTFLGNWNNFMWPLLVTQTLKMKTLPVGITYFIGQYATNWPLLMAAATLAMLPMMIIYLFAQKYFVAGVTLTGMKS